MELPTRICGPSVEREPVADAALREIAPGGAVARIIETQEGAPSLARPVVEKARFGRGHIGGEPAEPDQSRPAVAALRPRAQAPGDAPGRAALRAVDLEEIGFVLLFAHAGPVPHTPVTLEFLSASAHLW